MKSRYIRDIHSAWESIGQNKEPSDKDIELAIYQKMLDVFQVGKFYYFVFIPSTTEIKMISKGQRELLGYEEKEFTINKILEYIHPEDLPYFLDFERTVVDFKTNLSHDKILKYKARYDYRIKKKNGEYIRVLQQSLTIQADPNGAVLANLVVHTDISHLKENNKMELSFIGLDGEKSMINVEPKFKYIPTNETLTPREMEVLKLVSENKTSEEIADVLSISVQTVRTHRKNINRKADCSNVLELITKARINKWL